MDFREAIHLTNELLRNPESATAAKVGNLEHTFTREWELLALLTEFFVAANSKKTARPFKVKRPWDKKEKLGRASVSLEEAKRLFPRIKKSPRKATNG